jgi:pimeloyl-ACP methyl ester carboxylesterase
MRTRYRTVNVDGLDAFFREAGLTDAPALLLLHGFATSSHMFRELIRALADRYYAVAPDLPGFGFSDAPDRTDSKYSFDHLTDVIDWFTELLGLSRYAVYVFDYGAPIGFRLALRRPERIVAVISQNGNAFLDGLSEGWNPIQTYWKNPSRENRAALRGFLTPEATRTQYAAGVPTPELLSPDAWTLDSALLAHPTPVTSLYGSGKAAINLLTKSWTAEYGASGVCVNAVSPGSTRTEGIDAMGEGVDRLAAEAPAGRPATADEIAEAVEFLATDRSSFIQGAKLAVDGGRTAI